LPRCEEVLKQISAWLQQGDINAENLVDFPWEVNREEKSLKAIYPRFPIEINITCEESIGFIRLSTTLDAETFTLSKDDKLLIYYKFLRRNNAPLVKYALKGDEAFPVLMVDLSIKTLGKEEFNDALALLLGAVNDVINLLGLEEYFKEKMFTTLLSLVAKHVEEGWGRDKIYDYLTSYVGLSKEEAREIVSSMFKQAGGKPSPYV